ncbi:c-type cytochrome [Alkalihalobacillus sp. CinArs1]|uniref:c-type cytochrome n=1 Tax=Alkalihalobacillus sp. CinArs1 TaxID=2995314 RepID=UPI0022DE69B3|nr:c-type cytochrome [Alkalihalobacillus sp. CinArs1]
MLKRWLTVLFGLVLAMALTACGGNNGDEGAMNEGSSDETTEEESGDSAQDYDVEAAEATYEQQCLQCHGENLKGDVGPALTNVGERLSKDTILNIVQNGKGQMPANLVEGEEAENLASWLANMK